MPDPETGEPINVSHMIPRSREDIIRRHRCLQRVAEQTVGLMGRSPDHVAGFFTGYAATPELFAAAGQKYADNVVKFYERMRDEYLYLSYAIVPPQIDRGKPAHRAGRGGERPDLPAGRQVPQVNPVAARPGGEEPAAGNTGRSGL